MLNSGLPHRNPPAGETIMRLEHFNHIANLIGLKKKSREAVWLIEIDGMTGYAASRQLDISQSTVSRAHARFRKALHQINQLTPHLPL
jgi:DNA-directed RNA polymerase specialized sigma24 family protein